MPTPRKVNSNSRGGGGGGSKAQFFERKYDTKMEFPEGVQFKKPSVGEHNGRKSNFSACIWGLQFVPQMSIKPQGAHNLTE